MQIDPASDHPCQFILHGDELKPGCVSGIELHQNVHVAVRPEIIAQHRAEQGQPPDMMPPAEVSYSWLRDGKSFSHGFDYYYLATSFLVSQRILCFPLKCQKTSVWLLESSIYDSQSLMCGLGMLIQAITRGFFESLDQMPLEFFAFMVRY